MKRHLRKPSPAMVVACMSLFIALGGTSFAAIALTKNSVLSKHIKNGQVKRADLATGAVNSAKVGDASLFAQDFAPGQLPKGEQGERGPAGPLVAPEDWDEVGDADGPAFGQASGSICEQGETGNYPGGAYNSAAFYRDPWGTVHLKGLVQVDDAFPCELLFGLPPGYRPARREIHEIYTSVGPRRLNIDGPNLGDGTGAVVLEDPPASNGVYALDGITFRCAPSGQNGCP